MCSVIGLVADEPLNRHNAARASGFGQHPGDAVNRLRRQHQQFSRRKQLAAR